MITDTSAQQMQAGWIDAILLDRRAGDCTASTIATYRIHLERFAKSGVVVSALGVQGGPSRSTRKGHPMLPKITPQPAPTGPELACVVLSLRNERGLVGAVQSLLAQDTPSEIVVVNSGGGDPEGTLRQAGLRTTVVTRHERLNPAAASDKRLPA